MRDVDARGGRRTDGDAWAALRNRARDVLAVGLEDVVLPGREAGRGAVRPGREGHRRGAAPEVVLARGGGARGGGGERDRRRLRQRKGRKRSTRTAPPLCHLAGRRREVPPRLCERPGRERRRRQREEASRQGAQRPAPCAAQRHGRPLPRRLGREAANAWGGERARDPAAARRPGAGPAPGRATPRVLRRRGVARGGRTERPGGPIIRSRGTAHGPSRHRRGAAAQSLRGGGDAGERGEAERAPPRRRSPDGRLDGRAAPALRPRTPDEVPASGFRLPASGFRLPASGFRLPASGFRLPNYTEGLARPCQPPTRGPAPADSVSRRGTNGNPSRRVAVSEHAPASLARGDRGRRRRHSGQGRMPALPRFVRQSPARGNPHAPGVPRAGRHSLDCSADLGPRRTNRCNLSPRRRRSRYATLGVRRVRALRSRSLACRRSPPP